MRNVQSSWLSSGGLYEKYSCEEVGQGGGGEYTVQTGFGWTNGVSLSLLDKYPDLSSAPSTSTSTSMFSLVASVLVGLMSLFSSRV